MIELIHPFIVHISIVSILLSSIFAIFSLILQIKAIKLELRSQLFFSSKLLLIIGELFLIPGIITGFSDVGSFDAAANDAILNHKIELAVKLIFILLIPISCTFYAKLLNVKLFYNERILSYIYTFGLFVGSIIILFIGAAGGYYNYNHSFFDDIGLGRQFRAYFTNRYVQNRFNSLFPSFVGLIIYLFILIFPYGRNVFRHTNLIARVDK